MGMLHDMEKHTDAERYREQQRKLEEAQETAKRKAREAEKQIKAKSKF